MRLSYSQRITAFFAMNIQHNTQLQTYNSFRTQAVAKLFAQTETIEELLEVLQKYPNEEKLVLGNGCNLFFTKDYNGLIIKPSMKGIRIINKTTNHVDIEAGAAEDWDDFVDYCVTKGWSGIENLSLIPGSVGAAPIQNIGAYGTEVKNVIVTVNAVDITTGNIISFNNEDCLFEYRDSIFKKTRRYVITSVVFRLNKQFTYVEKYIDLKKELEGISSPTLLQVRNAIINIRNRKLPNHKVTPNAGSFFKNPILTSADKDELLNILPEAPIYDYKNNLFKTSAAYLIEKAGYKGRRSGNVGTYPNHALIIVNYGTNSGEDIADFMKEIQKTVDSEFKIKLEPEVWIF